MILTWNRLLVGTILVTVPFAVWVIPPALSQLVSLFTPPYYGSPYPFGSADPLSDEALARHLMSRAFRILVWIASWIAPLVVLAIASPLPRMGRLERFGWAVLVVVTGVWAVFLTRYTFRPDVAWEHWSNQVKLLALTWPWLPALVTFLAWRTKYPERLGYWRRRLLAGLDSWFIAESRPQ